MPNIRGPELLIILLIVVLLFGAKRLPDAARGIGRSLRIFKAETKGLVESEVVPNETPANQIPAPAEIPAAQQASSATPAQDATPAQQPAPQTQPPSPA
jgi:sec-independent protein translocase protein TatA